MIVDTIRNGKAVSIEIRDNRVVGASVDQPRAKEPKITKAMRKAVSLNGRKSHTYIDLGLALLSTKEWGMPFGCGRTLETISAFCGCSRQAIERIEKKAMRKVRAALYRDPALEKELKQMFGK